nr:uncharacterized protein LOC119171450 [Rhipicephalus microplus]
MEVHSDEDVPAEEELPPKPLPLAHRLVPVGAAPVKPGNIPPAPEYENDSVYPEDAVAKENKHAMQPPQHKTSLTFIFGLAVVIITLTAVAALYAMDPARNVVSAATTTLEPSNITGINVTGKALVDD